MLVESLVDKKRIPAFSHEKISSLKEISVFTTGEDKPLRDILKVLHEKFEGKPAIDPKADDKTLKAFFLEIVPDYDPERVYISDIKKIIAWYNLLAENNILDFTEPEEEKTDENEEKQAHEKEVVPKTARKTKAPVPSDAKEHHSAATTQKKTRKKV